MPADPLLVVPDRVPGLIRAVGECFPRSARRRGLAHRMRNPAAKVPTDLWPEFEVRVCACYQTPSRAIARQLAAGIRDDYADLLPSVLRRRTSTQLTPSCARCHVRTATLNERLATLTAAGRLDKSDQIYRLAGR